MRLFLFNQESNFDLEQISERTKVSPFEARQEINALERIGLLKKKSFFRDLVVGRKKEIERHRVHGWILDETFEYLAPLRNFLSHISTQRNNELLKKLARVGKLRLVIISGFFIQNWDSRVDLLVVGDNIKKGTLENIIKTIESEMGREIRYTAFETPDFKYRLGVYDKLIRDIIDYEHEVILDKVGIQIK